MNILRYLKCNISSGKIKNSIYFIIFALGIYAFVIEPRWVEITGTEVEIVNLPDEFEGFRIVFFSDIHRGSFVSERYVARVAEMVNKQRPDIVLCAGDFVTGSADYSESLIAPLKNIKAEFGKYAVLGNHDSWTCAEKVEENVGLAGFRFLKNGAERVTRGSSYIIVAGIDDLWTGKPDIAEAFKGCSEKDIKILLSHNPDIFERIDRYNVDLVLAGHTHGGQVCIPFFGPVIVPSMYHRKYAAGFFRRSRGAMYVTRGIGTYILPVRFLCRPEITVIVLKKSGAAR